MDSSQISPCFTRGEYWLLEAVVRSPLELPLLLDKDLETALNKENHGLDRENLAKTLNNLSAQDLIRFVENQKDFPLALNLEELLSAFDKPGNAKESIYYGLTPKGGAYWESFARPDWSQYIDASATTVSGNGEATIWGAEIIGVDREKIEQLLQSNIYYHKQSLLPETVKRESLIPWQATYWKQLPAGYKICYQYTETMDWTGWDEIPVSHHNLISNRYFYRWG
jgi:hypothetical protein